MNQGGANLAEQALQPHLPANRIALALASDWAEEIGFAAQKEGTMAAAWE